MRSRRDPAVNRYALSALRKVAGMTRFELARRAGIHDAQVSRLESGKRKRPTTETLAALAAVLNVPVEALIAAELDGEAVSA